MQKKAKKDLMLIILAVVLFAVLLNLRAVISFMGKIINLIMPLLLGLLFALILNAPMRGFENLFDKCFAKSKRKISLKTKYSVSLLLSVLSIILAFVLVFTMAIPKLFESAKSLFLLIDQRIPDFLLLLEKYDIDTSFITDKLSTFNSEEIIKNLTAGAVSIFSTAVDATKVAVKFFTTAIFSFIISIYLLLDKNNISRQFKKFVYKIIPPKKADFIYETCYLVRDTFSRFLRGQCLEALILALLIFAVFTILKLPYASLIAVMAAVLSFIPYIGSFVACAIGTFLTLISDPNKALLCLIVYLLAQFVEQHFIYPHIVGNSVGLSPFYTIVAALLGGKLFGVFGMVFFIPLFSVIFTVLRDFTNKDTENTDTNIKKETTT